MTTPPAMPELPDGATVLPDGSAFAIASFPLPSDHWLYAPRAYRDGEEEPIELPSPILSHQAHGDIVRAAIRYAVRSATMCGKEPDFDPDALVQNAMYALCGPFGGAALQAQPAAAGVSDVIAMVRERYRGTKWGKAAECICDAVDEAILALRQQAVPMTDAWAAGVQAAADLLKRMADETALERGETDPDTGAIQFKSAATREWHASLCELAEEIERLKPAHHGITAPAGGEG